MAKTVGSTSFVLVTMSQLKSVFGDGAQIPISRVFARQNNLVAVPVHAQAMNAGAPPEQTPDIIPIQEITEYED